jgi:hypothetical protein
LKAARAGEELASGGYPFQISNGWAIFRMHSSKVALKAALKGTSLQVPLLHSYRYESVTNQLHLYFQVHGWCQPRPGNIRPLRFEGQEHFLLNRGIVN